MAVCLHSFIALAQLTCWVSVVFFSPVSMIYTSPVLNGVIQPALAVYTLNIKTDCITLIKDFFLLEVRMAILTGTSSLGEFICAGKYAIRTSYSNKKT